MTPNLTLKINFKSLLKEMRGFNFEITLVIAFENDLNNDETKHALVILILMLN